LTNLEIINEKEKKLNMFTNNNDQITSFISKKNGLKQAEEMTTFIVPQAIPSTSTTKKCNESYFYSKNDIQKVRKILYNFFLKN